MDSERIIERFYTICSSIGGTAHGLSEAVIDELLDYIEESPILINVVKDGSWMRYSINKERADILLAFLGKITENKSECICKSIDLRLKDHC